MFLVIVSPEVARLVRMRVKLEEEDAQDVGEKEEVHLKQTQHVHCNIEESLTNRSIYCLNVKILIDLLLTNYAYNVKHYM